MRNLSREDIEDIDDPIISDAVFAPDAPAIAWKVFKFLLDNQNLVTSFSGMATRVTGLDRSKLIPVARDGYGLDLSRYMFAVNMFESGLLARQDMV